MPKFNINLKELDWQKIVALLAVLIVGLLGGWGLTAVYNPNEKTIELETNSIELAPEQVEATVTTESGEEEVVDIPTVEEVTSNQVIEEDTPDEGLGEYHDTSSPQAYKNATLGKCTDVDGKYGAQCFDLASDFWKNYAGRWLSSCGTGAAKGTLNCYEYNAGNEFVMIWNANELQAGDWVVFDSGQYGHIGMAMGNYNNGYVTLLGQNQGGASCSGGGSSANIINISLKSFKGAFRPKSYIKPEPKPAPTPTPIPVTGCTEWDVLKGHTMSFIMASCEGGVVYGEAMDNYAKTWYSRIVKPGQSVYEGWNTGTHYGLYAGDTIDHKVGK